MNLIFTAYVRVPDSSSNLFPQGMRKIRNHFVFSLKFGEMRNSSSPIAKCQLLLPEDPQVLNKMIGSKNYCFVSAWDGQKLPPIHKSVNLQYDTLGQWAKRLGDQVSDVPSIIFFIISCKILWKNPFNFFFLITLQK